jgi:hypothetical protein
VCERRFHRMDRMKADRMDRIYANDECGLQNDE